MSQSIKTHNKRYLFICDICTTEVPEIYEIVTKATTQSNLDITDAKLQVCHRCFLDIIGE